MSIHHTSLSDSTVSWLLEGDVSIRYQVMRDLIASEDKATEKERQKVAAEGWGNRLLSFQDEEGTWAKAVYSPKWISTTYTLILLKRFGLPQGNAQAQKGAQSLLERGFFKDGGINYWKTIKQSETCVTGLILNICSYFQIKDDRLHEIAKFLFKEQMKDLGWNCRSVDGATHSSFHTSLIVMEALWDYAQLFPEKKDEIMAKIMEGMEFLLQHWLYKSDKTGKVVKPAFTMFSFPPRWYYDVMKALDFAQLINAPKDERFEDAINLLKKKQNNDGTWNLQNRHSGKTFFELESVGKPSRWNTLRAYRILKWWDNKVS